MKYLKLDITPEIGKTQLKYPDNYQVDIGNYAVDHLYYDEAGKCYLILLIPDKQYKPEMLKSGVSLITETTAKQTSVDKEPLKETITDEAKIRRLEIKSNLGQALTDSELKALDPNDPTPGIEYEKRLTDRIATLKDDEIFHL